MSEKKNENAPATTTDAKAETQAKVEPETPKGPAEGTLEFWAAKAGHIPKPGPRRFRGDIHTGPNWLVVMQHSGLARNSPISEAEYEKQTKAAYELTIRES